MINSGPVKSVDLSIREVLGGAAGDREALLSIIAKSDNLSDEERDCAREILDIYLENKEKGYLFLTATVSGLPVGYICYGRTPLTDSVFDIYWILVHPDYRRRGVATDLLEYTEALIRQGGARMMMAETSGLAAYSPAREFYHMTGFKEEARIKGFYKTGDDLVVFVKRFGQT
ncbi:MAG TPA: GNAT family N-acetyltransferase [Thermodesulfobacteriota bacterium]|nr:GNAT family N-acetyltransferase [Thermodesulfobacteriota bacterium]